MIVSEQLKIAKTAELTSDYIESELKKHSIEPLRWAIVEVQDEFYVLSVSYVV